MLDRFLSQKDDHSIAKECIDDRKKYQLAAMTCLYTAIKLTESEVLDPEVIASLSRGMATPVQVVQMEGYILRVLDWHIGTPTGTDVVDHLVQLLPVKPKTVVLLPQVRLVVRRGYLAFRGLRVRPPQQVQQPGTGGCAVRAFFIT